MSTSREETREQKPSGGTASSSKIAGNAKRAYQTSDTKVQATGSKQTDGEDLLQHAKKATGEIVTQVQQRAGSELYRQKDSAASDLASIVNAVRGFGESLARDEGGPIARYLAEYGDKAADGLDRFASYIREQDTRKLMSDVTDFGKRRPALLLGSAFLLGLAGARLIKSGVDNRIAGESSDEGYPVSEPVITNSPVGV